MAFNGFDKFKNGDITREQLEQQWEEYKANFKDNEIQPLLDKLNAAKQQYFNTYYDLINTKNQFIADNSRATSKEFNLPAFDGHINIERVNNPRYFISERELTGLYTSATWGHINKFEGVIRDKKI
jgi:hypothetical protein